MKKVLVLLLVCFMALGAPLAMADTRTDSLGLTAGQQIDDLDSIFAYPQDAARFGNVADYRLGEAGSGSWSDNWFGVVHKDWDEIGYLGIYANRPFNQSNGIRPNRSWANEGGILDGNNTWSGVLNPDGDAWIEDDLVDPFGRIPANFTNIGFIFPGAVPTDPENKFDLFWAKDSDDSTIGVHINYASQNTINGVGSVTKNSAGAPAVGDDVGKTDNRGSNVIGGDIGLGLKNLGDGPFQSLDFSVGYSMGMVDYSNTNTRENATQTGTNVIFTSKISDDNISEIRANILAKSKINDSTTGRIYVNARVDNLGLKQTFQNDANNDADFTDANETSTRTKGYSDLNIQFGLACDHKVADGRANVIAGVGFTWDNRTWKQSGFNNLAGNAAADQIIAGSGSTFEETWVEVPFNVAVEAPIFPWLKARVGAHKHIFRTVTDKTVEQFNVNAGGTAFQDINTVTQTVDWDENIRMTYGVGATLENFTLNLEIATSAIENYLGSFQPGNGIFYHNGATDVFTQADIKYAF